MRESMEQCAATFPHLGGVALGRATTPSAEGGQHGVPCAELVVASAAAQALPPAPARLVGGILCWPSCFLARIDFAIPSPRCDQVWTDGHKLEPRKKFDKCAIIN